MKKLILTLLACVCFATAGFAQNSDKISEILENDEISKGQASYFACVYKNLSDESATEDDAFNLLLQKNLFKSTEKAEDKISLSKACYIISETAKMKGGLFYSISHSARYSLREFKALGIVPANADPSQNVSGSEFIALLNGFDKKGKTK